MVSIVNCHITRCEKTKTECDDSMPNKSQFDASMQSFRDIPLTVTLHFYDAKNATRIYERGRTLRQQTKMHFELGEPVRGLCAE